MKETNTGRVIGELTSDNLRRHRIIRAPERPIARLTVYLLNIRNNGMMAEYRARIEEFRIYVKVLNLHFKTIAGNKIIGQGSYGSIMEKSVAMQEFVVKVQWK
jgi:hypothetical protein